MGDDTEQIERKVTARMHESVKRMAVVLGVAATGVTLLGAWVTFPHRLGAVEKSVERVSMERSGDHEALVRIEERLIEIQRRLERIERNGNQ
jgi:hypothetical protein